ncbi:MAG: site-specific integrase [Chloroflexota bacterium]|nr:site-specific integrase [Chloroflexota bacterium]
MRKRGHGEGTIYQRPDGIWCGQVRLPGQRKTVYGKTRAEVQRKIRAIVADAEQGIMPAPERLTVAAFLERWLADDVSRLDQYTVKNYSIYVRRHIIPKLGKIKLAQLQPAHVQGLYAAMQQRGLAPKTIRNAHGVLRTALGKAVAWGLVPRNVAALAAPPKAPSPEFRTLTVEEAKRIDRATQGNRWAPMLLLALTTGLRQGELLGLKWGDIDFAAGVLQVRRQYERDGTFSTPKASSQRRLDLAQAELRAFAIQREAQERDRERWGDRYIEQDLVFATHQGRPLMHRNVFREFKRLLKKADLPGVRFHDLRHTNATLMLGQGVHPKVVQERLGHSQVGITLNIYSHVLPGLGREAIERLGAALHEEDVGEQQPGPEDDEARPPQAGSGADE